MKRILPFLLLIGIAPVGCSSSENVSVAGKYSRRITHVTPDGKSHGKYTVTTELKADGTYSHSTNRGGTYSVLETGRFKVKKNSITFYARTGRQAGEVRTDAFDGKAIAPEKYFRRVKE